MNSVQRFLSSALGIRESQAEVQVREQVNIAETLLATQSQMLLRESMAAIQLEIEDREWQRVASETQTELSYDHRRRLIQQARWMFLKNPIIKHSVRLLSYYVFGRGFTITADNDAAKETLDKFFSNPRNLKEIGHVGLVEKHQSLQTDGDSWFCYFSDLATGETLVRSFDALEVQDIISNPDDSSEEWFFKRCWQQETYDTVTGTRNSATAREAWYPAIDYFPPKSDRPDKIGGVVVDWFHPVQHDKYGGLSKWRFGLPNVWASLAWARSYKEFLEHWLTIQAAYSRIALVINTPGGSKSVRAIGSRLQTTVGSGNQGETNPPPNTASTWVGGPNQQVTALKTAGATTGPEEARRAGMMAGIGMGFPETMALGDTTTGSLATATSLDRPTELMAKDEQKRWESILGKMARFVLARSAGAPKGTLREAQRAATDVKVVVEFPDILEHDVAARVDAWVKAVASSLVDPRTASIGVLSDLGVKDAGILVEEQYPIGEYNAADYAAIPALEMPATTNQNQPNQPVAKATAEALRDLSSALTEFRATANGRH